MRTRCDEPAERRCSGIVFLSDEETQQGEIAATGVPPRDDRESAILQLLRAGNYTAIVRWKESTSGVTLVEAFNLR